VDLEDFFDLLYFYIGKERGAFITIEEMTNIVHEHQMALFMQYKPKYATNQIIKDILSPFKNKYPFLPIDMVGGHILLSPTLKKEDFLDIEIDILNKGVPEKWALPLVNEDERAFKLKSQIDPVTVNSPIGEQEGERIIKVYPLSAYSGTVSYLRLPVKPFYNYTVVGGRIPVYNSIGSTQLEWRETEIREILFKCLKTLGVNLSDEQIQQFAQVTTNDNAQGLNTV
jgi:hypothetical protein